MIVGLLGQAGVGKDTFADHLVLKYGFVKVSLADPLKRICREVYDFSEEQLWGPSEERNKEDLRYPRGIGDGYLSPRVALQTLGTEWGRHMYSNTWIEYGIRMAKRILEEGRPYSAMRGMGAREEAPNPIYRLMKRKEGAPRGVVIPDLRYKNEVELVRKAGGSVLKLVRAGKNGDVGIKGHASEEEQKSIPDDAFNLILRVPEGHEKYYELIDRSVPSLPGFVRAVDAS